MSDGEESGDDADSVGPTEGRAGPPPHGGATDADSRSEFRRFLDAETGPYFYLRETITSVLIVGCIGLLLFGISGVWPPMVAVESGSMEPHMDPGDLVFVTEPDRFSPGEAIEDTGAVPRDRAKEVGYRKFGGYGSVIVYDPPSRSDSPIIHRTHLWVEEGENWYDRANPDYIQAENCEELAHCPAEYDGFITKGDNNARYDQVSGISPPVKPGWIRGVARVRVPYLGWIRLAVSGGGVVYTDAGTVADDGVRTVADDGVRTVADERSVVR